MMESWAVGVFIKATSNLATVMTGGAASTARLNGALSSQNALLARRTELLRQVSMTQQSARFATAAFATLGMAAGAAIYAGVRGAADLQSAMISVGISTNTASSKMADFYALVMKVSGVTAQSATTIGGELAVAAAAGLTNPKQLQSAFPQIAKAADALWVAGKATGRSINPQQAVLALSQLTHLFGAYSGAPLADMLNKAVEAFFVQPEAINRIVMQGKMFIPLALSAGISTGDIWDQILMMGQSGYLRGRGGSGVRMSLQRMLGASSGTIAGTLTAKQSQAAYQLGITDKSGRDLFEDKTGHALFEKMVEHLHAIQTNFTPANFTKELLLWAGPQGGSLLAAELRPAAYAQAQQNITHMREVGTVDKVFGEYFKGFNLQASRFATNFKNLFIDVMLPLLKPMTDDLKQWADALSKAGDWLVKHPKQAADIGKGLFVTVGYSIAGMTATAATATLTIWKLNAALAALDITAGAGGPGGKGAPNNMSFLGKAGAFAGGALNFLTFGGLGAARWLLGTAVPGILGGIGKGFLSLLGWVNKLGPLGTRLADFGLKLGNPLELLGNTISTFMKGLLGANLSEAMFALRSIGLGILDFAGMILKWADPITTFFALIGATTGQANPTTAQESAAVAAFDQRMHLGAGRPGGASGTWGAPTVHIHIDSPHLHIDHTTTPEHARKMSGILFDELVKKVQSASDRTGSLLGASPFLPVPALLSH
jgi:hypothetical protein